MTPDAIERNTYTAQKLGDSVDQAMKEIREHQKCIEKILAALLKEAVKMKGEVAK